MTIRKPKPWILLSVTVLLLFISTLHTYLYHDLNYRQDEISAVHSSVIMTPSEIVQWLATDVHPPGWLLMADLWMETFGISETITRWSSKLLNLLTFALLFQLGQRVIDTRTGFFAVALLGIYGFASSGMKEIRPNTLLITLTTALHLIFYLWITKPRPHYLVLYVLLGVASIYTHFFAFFIFPAHALFLFMFHKFERRMWLNSIIMWSVIAVSFSAWLLPFLYVLIVPFSGGIYYGVPDGLVGVQLLYHRIKFKPELILHFLLIFSLFAPKLLLKHTFDSHTLERFRLYKYWNLLYPLCLLVFTLVIVYVANTFVSSLTARNLQLIVMLIVLLMALGLRLLPIQASFILLLILYIGAPTHLKTSKNPPYREITQTLSASYQQDSIIITEFSSAFFWLAPMAWYIMDFTPYGISKHHFFNIIDADDAVHPPATPENLVNIYRSFDVNTFSSTLPEHNQLWFLQQGGGTLHSQEVETWLNSHYSLINTHHWEEIYPSNFTLKEYRKVPVNAELMLRAGKTLELEAWSLQESVEVTPCQAITVESWWKTRTPTDNPLQINIILADDNGQLAIGEDFPSNTFTTNWNVDTYYRDLTQITIPCDINAGRYNLLLGMKDSITGEILPLTYPDGNDIGSLYYLTTVHTQGE